MKHVLVALSGLSPQIVTETLYGLMVESRDPVPIREVHVLTTARGRDVGLRALLGRKGWFRRFCRDYGFTEIRFPEENFHVLGGPEGLDDIRSGGENSRVAEEIVSFIREMTRDHGTALHCSAAGGRKTMGIYLASALQLYGRPQDTLSHVLVSEDFESCPEFFYKPPRNRRIFVTGRDGRRRRLETKNARIELARIPFVRLRQYLPSGEDLLFHEIVRLAQDGIESCPNQVLRIDLPGRAIRYGERRISMPPVELAFYGLFTARKRACTWKRSCADCDGCYLTPADFRRTEVSGYLRAAYEKIHGPGSCRTDRFDRELRRLRRDYVHERVSRINRVLRKALPSNALALLRVRNTGTRRSARYGINQDKALIRPAVE